MDYLKEFERRYGKKGKDVVTLFGNQYVNGINGWQFDLKKIREANKAGKLITLDIDFPGNRCKLDCSYCFAKSGEHTGTYYRPDKGDKPLSIDELKKHILEAKKLGLESVKIIGYREPFDNEDFFDFVDFLSQNSVIPVVFTAGYTLGEKEFGGNVQKTIDFLASRNVSLMVKLHTLDSDAENKIVRSNDYAVRRDRYLRLLLDDKRFVSSSPTRLGIENVIASQNIEELIAMYEYFKIWRNVFIDIDPPIPIGRTATKEDIEKTGLLSQESLIGLCTEIYEINRKYGIPFEGISPYFGGLPCNQLSNGLYISLSGKVFPCCGGFGELGNVRNESISDIFHKNSFRIKLGDRVYHDCPFRAERGIMTRDFIKEVERRLVR